MRRAARQPVAQILGRRQFWGHSFRVTPDVLDPRPETEVLVAEALAEPVSRLLDLGTGSGAILLSVLSSSPASTGIGTDLSQAALAVARGNARALGLAARAAFRHGNWFEAVAPGCSFDLILSNPPYITQAELAALDPEVRLWEPALALSPGGDGLDAYRAIAAGALARLTPGGRLAVEIGPTQARAVGDLMAAAGLRDPRVVSDLDGRPRVVLARRPR
jgi:release factor glutamine methyltransferase